MRLSRAPGKLVAILCLPACAYYSQEDGDRLANEVYALQTQVTALQKSVSDLQSEQSRHGTQIAKMSQEVGELNKAARRNDADLGVQLDEMMEDVARMRGRVESFGERMSALESQTSQVREEVEVRFQGLGEKQRIEAAASEEEKQQAIEEARKRERLIADPKAALAEVDHLLEGGKPADARKLLRELEVRQGEDRTYRRRYQARAQFLIGESFFAEGNFQQAAAEYNTVRKKHPKSKRVPDALYRLGECFEKLNLKEDAKLFYQTVVKKYGRTSAAKKARARLKKL